MALYDTDIRIDGYWVEYKRGSVRFHVCVGKYSKGKKCDCPWGKDWQSAAEEFQFIRDMDLFEAHSQHMVPIYHIIGPALASERYCQIKAGCWRWEDILVMNDRGFEYTITTRYLYQFGRFFYDKYTAWMQSIISEIRTLPQPIAEEIELHL
jgi:hypothetical protein